MIHQRALDDPAAGQHLEDVQVIGALDDLQGAVQRAGLYRFRTSHRAVSCGLAE
jgi:hypothetical protein